MKDSVNLHHEKQKDLIKTSGIIKEKVNIFLEDSHLGSSSTSSLAQIILNHFGKINDEVKFSKIDINKYFEDFQEEGFDESNLVGLIYQLQIEYKSVNVTKILKKIIEELSICIENETINCLTSEIGDYIENVDSEYIRSYYEKLGKKGYSESFDYITSNQKLINNIADISKENFFEKFPDLLDIIDKDGLIDISSHIFPEIQHFNPDGIYLGTYFIYFDELYSDINLIEYFGVDFLEFFLLLKGKYKSKNTKFKLKLNFDKIISLEKYKQISLLGGTGYGPEYKERNFFTKLNSTLFTRKERLNSKFNKYFGNNITYTDFYLDQKNNSFMIEEIGENYYNKPCYVNRLIHSEFDINRELVTHFDGSILFYEPENIELRKYKKLSDYPKLSFKKSKIFRIDGDLEMKDFIFLNLLFFVNNELILEYFDKEHYKEIYSSLLDYENAIDY